MFGNQFHAATLGEADRVSRSGGTLHRFNLYHGRPSTFPNDMRYRLKGAEYARVQLIVRYGIR